MVIASSPEDTGRLLNNVFRNIAGANTRSPRSYSGRKLAPTVWHTHSPGGGPIRGSTQLMACDGRAYVRIIAQHRISGRVNGRLAQPQFSDGDLRLIEDLATTILDRATALGYTSRSARSVSPTLRRAVEQRRNVLRATPPKPAVRPPSPNPMIPPPLAERWRSNQPPPRKR